MVGGQCLLFLRPGWPAAVPIHGVPGYLQFCGYIALLWLIWNLHCQPLHCLNWGALHHRQAHISLSATAVHDPIRVRHWSRVYREHWHEDKDPVVCPHDWYGWLWYLICEAPRYLQFCNYVTPLRLLLPSGRIRKTKAMSAINLPFLMIGLSNHSFRYWF